MLSSSHIYKAQRPESSKMDPTQEANQKSKARVYSLLCWLLAACGGLMFGYDIGISGGVTSMDDFLIKFFPKVYQRKIHTKENNYCKFDDQLLQLFTSSLYLAAVVASFIASKCCSKYGRKVTILAASVFLLIGAGISAGAQFNWMLIVGRVFLGFGVGFGNESVPLFLSETAPVKYRGSVNILFQLFVTIGILIANVVNYLASFVHPNGWRISLGIAAVPAALLFIGSFVIPETPTSLIQRGDDKSGKEALKLIRGLDEQVEEEYKEIKEACEKAEIAKGSFFEMVKKRSNWPPLIIGVMIQVFQQFTGINAIMFYAPVLFQTVGMKTGASLASSVITGFINVLSTCLAVYFVDKAGRRFLLLLACVIMFISQVIIGGFLLGFLHDSNTLSMGLGIVVVVFVCMYVMSFAWSWGPMGWLIPSETFPLEIRTEGFACAVSTNMIFTFIIAQAFLTMLCHMKGFIFFFFAAWIVIMALFVYFLVPETKNVPIDAMPDRVWKLHPVWSKCMNHDQDQGLRKRVKPEVV